MCLCWLGYFIFCFLSFFLSSLKCFLHKLQAKERITKLFLFWVSRQPYNESKNRAFKIVMNMQPKERVRRHSIFTVPLLLNSSFPILQRLLIIPFPKSQMNHISRVLFYNKKILGFMI